MHPCATLLDELLALIPAEEKALADEDMDRAEELAGQRADLLQKVWQRRDGYDSEDLRQSLLKVKDEQARLREAAEALHAKLRAQQRAGRKQTRYLNADRHVQAQLQRAFYCDKIS